MGSWADQSFIPRIHANSHANDGVEVNAFRQQQMWQEQHLQMSSSVPCVSSRMTNTDGVHHTVGSDFCLLRKCCCFLKTCRRLSQGPARGGTKLKQSQKSTKCGGTGVTCISVGFEVLFFFFCLLMLFSCAKKFQSSHIERQFLFKYTKEEVMVQLIIDYIKKKSLLI